MTRVQTSSVLLHYCARHCIRNHHTETNIQQTELEKLYMHRCTLTLLVLPKYLNGLFVSTNSFVTLAHISSTQPCTSLSSKTLSFKTVSIACKVFVKSDPIQSHEYTYIYINLTSCTNGSICSGMKVSCKRNKSEEQISLVCVQAFDLTSA
jgi:hypothetical protein